MSRPRKALPGELTPRRIANLRKRHKTAREFASALESLGYHYLSEGCYRSAYRYQHGKYVIKVALNYAGKRHTMAQNRHFENAKPEVKARMLPFLVYGPDYQVQEHVRECHNFSCQVPGFGDTCGHNHTHRWGKAVAFDWMGVPR